MTVFLLILNGVMRTGIYSAHARIRGGRTNEEKVMVRHGHSLEGIYGSNFRRGNIKEINNRRRLG